MRILVTGSAGYLGEALVGALAGAGHDALGIDVRPSASTARVGSITDRAFVRAAMRGVDAVVHTATLHKPHVETHSRQEFVDTNVTGTLNLLEEASAARASAFVFTSTTSTFGRALTPPPGAPAVWVTEDLAPIPKNIYGVTKIAAEDLCELFHRNDGLACVVLRTSRFFPEDDDDPAIREAYDGENAKTNELLFRRVDLDDVVGAHLRGLARAPALGFGRYIVSATTPFRREDLPLLREDAPRVVARLFPAAASALARRGWKMFPSIDRVYDNERARRDLGWSPVHDFASRLARLARLERLERLERDRA